MSINSNEKSTQEKDEVSIIAHLLEIEKQASQIISAANIKGDKKISDAKIAAEAEFKKQYALKAEEIQKNFEGEKNKIQSEHDSIINEYKASVESKNQNKEAFGELLNQLLFS